MERQGGCRYSHKYCQQRKKLKSVNEFFSSEDDPKGKEIALNKAIIAHNLLKPGSLDRLWQSHAQIYTQKEANNNSSILTEIVVVYKAELFQQVANIRVKDWFIMTPANKLMRSSNDIQVPSILPITPRFTFIQNTSSILISGAMGAFYLAAQK